MLEIIGARQPLNVDAIISPAKKRNHGDRVIQNIANLSLRALISPAKTIQAVKDVERRLAPKRLFEDIIDKENDIPPTDPDIIGQSGKKIQSDTSEESKGVERRLAPKRMFGDIIAKENDIPPPQPDIMGQPVKKIPRDTSEESKGEPKDISSETSSQSVLMQYPVPADHLEPLADNLKNLLTALQKAQNLRAKLLGAFQEDIANDPLMHYWYANPWSGTDFRAFDSYNDTHDTEVSFKEFIEKKQKLELYHKAKQHIHWTFCRDFITCFNGSYKQFKSLLNIIRNDRYLNLDYLSFAKRLTHPALTEEEFSSITMEMSKEVSKYIYVEDHPKEIPFFKR